MENSNIDPLTGLYTRVFAQSALDELIANTQVGENVGLIYLDIDKFKDLNEIYGHYNGDAYLQGIATEIQRLAENYLVARFGGDEFAISMPGANQEKALELAENIRASIEKFVVEFETYSLGPLTVTIGVSCFPDDGETALKLLEEADLAVIIGKNHGRNCVLPARNPLRRDAPPY